MPATLGFAASAARRNQSLAEEEELPVRELELVGRGRLA
jgi:hypothetical protein